MPVDYQAPVEVIIQAFVNAYIANKKPLDIICCTWAPLLELVEHVRISARLRDASRSEQASSYLSWIRDSKFTAFSDGNNQIIIITDLILIII